MMEGNCLHNRRGKAPDAEQIAADVGMPGHSGERAIEHFVLQALVLNAAAAAVLDGNDAVDIRKIAERRLIETLGDVAADGG